MTNVILVGGGPDVKISYFIKLCLKSISRHSESFCKKKFQVKNGGDPHIQPFFTNFSNSKKFYKCSDLSFFAKVSQLSSPSPVPNPQSPNPKSKGLGVTIKSYGPPTTQPTAHSPHSRLLIPPITQTAHFHQKF